MGMDAPTPLASVHRKFVDIRLQQPGAEGINGS